MRRPPIAPLFSLLLCAFALAGCGRDAAPQGDLQVQVLQLQEELDKAKKSLANAEKAGAQKDDALVLARTEVEKSTKDVAERDRMLAEHQSRISALEKEIAELKKRDVFAYADASRFHEEGLNSSSLERYRQFVAAYPKSPLIADANRAIAELGVSAPREARARAEAIDPRASEREFVRKFNDGFCTLQDIASFLKGRTKGEVIRLLGLPNTTYREGTELGYVDKVLDQDSSRGTLVIGFDGVTVSTLRVGYAGRPMRP